MKNIIKEAALEYNPNNLFVDSYSLIKTRIVPNFSDINSFSEQKL